MKTIDEILDEFYNKMKLAECDRDPRNGGDIEVDDAFTEAKQAILKLIAEREREAKLDTLEELLDYYTPYRPMLDSAESMAVRLKIASCIAKLEGDKEKL